MSGHEQVPSLMPGLRADLERLVAIPSVSAPGYPAATPPAAARCVRAPGRAVRRGRRPGPARARAVYSHYDVVGTGDESLWSSPPFVATERDGALYGRGTADSKANVIAHVG